MLSPCRHYQRRSSRMFWWCAGFPLLLCVSACVGGVFLRLPWAKVCPACHPGYCPYWLGWWLARCCVIQARPAGARGSQMTAATRSIGAILSHWGRHGGRDWIDEYAGDAIVSRPATVPPRPETLADEDTGSLVCTSRYTRPCLESYSVRCECCRSRLVWQREAMYVSPVVSIGVNG